MGSKPNFHHLYHFWIVAQEGSLVGASRRLGVRHSTLSAQLQALEKSMGGRLLLRRPRGVRLTPRGEVIRGYCDQIFRLGAEMLEVNTGRAGTSLLVALLPSVPRSLGYQALRPALGADSAARVELRVADLDVACRNLLAGRLHVVLTDRLPPAGSALDVYAHLIGETRIGIYGTRRLASELKPGYPRSLDGAAMLLPTAGSPLRDALVGWFAEEGIRPRIIGEFDDVPIMKGFAARGHGVVPIRQSLAEEARTRYGLVPVGAVPGYKDRLYALTLGRRVRHPGVQRLIEKCRSQLTRS